MSDDEPTNTPPPRLRDLPRVEAASLRRDEHVTAASAPRLRRPMPVTVLGWVCAGIGYLSFFLKGAQLPVFFMDMRWLNPEYKPPHLTPGQFSAAVAILIAEMVVALIAIAGGLGALRLREWGRRLLIYYAVAGIAVALFKLWFQVATFDTQIDYRISTTMQYIDRDAMANREFFYLLSYTVMSLVWPALVITVMTRHHIRRAFAPAPTTAAALAELSSPGARSSQLTAESDDWRST